MAIDDELDLRDDSRECFVVDCLLFENMAEMLPAEPNTRLEDATDVTGGRRIEFELNPSLS